jgi:hypothetical protein
VVLIFLLGSLFFWPFKFVKTVLKEIGPHAQACVRTGFIGTGFISDLRSLREKNADPFPDSIAPDVVTPFL